MGTNISRNFAAEATFIDAWRKEGHIFTRNPRSDRMKKLVEGKQHNPELVKTLASFMGEAAKAAAQKGHSEALELDRGFRLVGSEDTPDLRLRFHLNNKYVKHPRPSPDSPPGLWFGSTSRIAWHQNTKELWGGEAGGLFMKHKEDGYKTWANLRSADKSAANHLISTMRDAVFAECSATGITAFINYLEVGENTLLIWLFSDDGGFFEAETFGPPPANGTPVVVTKDSHDRIKLQCGQWEFALRVHSAAGLLQATSFKVEINVPVHP